MSDVVKDKFYQALPYTMCHVETSSAVSMLHKKNQLHDITTVPVTQGTCTEPILMIIHTINILLNHLHAIVKNTEDNVVSMTSYSFGLGNCMLKILS